MDTNTTTPIVTGKPGSLERSCLREALQGITLPATGQGWADLPLPMKAVSCHPDVDAVWAYMTVEGHAGMQVQVRLQPEQWIKLQGCYPGPSLIDLKVEWDNGKRSPAEWTRDRVSGAHALHLGNSRGQIVLMQGGYGTSLSGRVHIPGAIYWGADPEHITRYCHGKPEPRWLIESAWSAPSHDANDPASWRTRISHV